MSDGIVLFSGISVLRDNPRATSRASVYAPTMAEAEGERLFREYLDAHGYQYQRPDQDDRDGKAADFRVCRDGASLAVAEVKQWDTFASPYPPAGTTGAVDPNKLYLPIRRSVGSAAPQLKAHLSEGLPLVVVLTNPRRFPIPLGDEDVRMALHGNPTLTAPVDPRTGTAGEATLHYGRDGRLRPPGEDHDGRHPYISAVAVLTERSYEADWHENRSRIGFGPSPESIAEAAEAWVPFVQRLEREKALADIPPGAYMSLSVYETFSVNTGDALPLPADLFNGPGDRRFAFTAEGVPRLLRGRDVARLFAAAREERLS